MEVGSIDITIVVVGIITLCGNVVSALLTFIGVVYVAASQRNKLHAETMDTLNKSKLTAAQVETEIQEGLLRLNNELEQKIAELKVETKELREEMRGLKEDKRILEERLLDVQRKYEAILQEYQALMADNNQKTLENAKLRSDLEEQKVLLEELKAKLYGTP